MRTPRSAGLLWFARSSGSEGERLLKRLNIWTGVVIGLIVLTGVGATSADQPKPQTEAEAEATLSKGQNTADEPAPETEAQAEEFLAEKSYVVPAYFIAVDPLVAVENSVAIGGDSYYVSGGFDIRIGYRHNRWLATEISGMYIHNYRDTEYLSWGMSLNEKLYFTKSRFQPYISLGMGFLQLISTSGRGTFSPEFSLRFGIGTEIYTTESVAVTVVMNYHMPFASANLKPEFAGRSDGTDFDFVTAGIGMIFY